MTEHKIIPDNPEEHLEDWISEKVAQRWKEENSKYLTDHGWKPDILDHPELIPPSQPGNFPGTSINYDSEFPQKVVTNILETISSTEEAEIVITKIFSQISRYEGRERDGDHHSYTYDKEIFTIYYIDTEAAISLARDTERLYQLLCKRITPHTATTEKVASKLFGPEIADRVKGALEDIPILTVKTQLQRKAIQFIQEQRIEKFEELCSYTADIIEQEACWEDSGEISLGHHAFGPIKVKKYGKESVEAAEEYLKEQGILEQDKTGRYSYTISCDDEGNEGFIDHLYPEYSIRWDKEERQWVYQWTIRHHARWDPERPLSENSTAYGYMLKHFGLANLPEPLPIEKGCKMSPTELQ